MIEVKLLDMGPNEVIELVRELRSLGYIQGKDFDFEYRPPKDNDWDQEIVYTRQTIFKFYKDELATWFELRYK